MLLPFGLFLVFFFHLLEDCRVTWRVLKYLDSRLQIWGNPSGCETSLKSTVPTLWGSMARGELKGLARTVRRLQLQERTKPLQAVVPVLPSEQGEGITTGMV